MHVIPADPPFTCPSADGDICWIVVRSSLSFDFFIAHAA